MIQEADERPTLAEMVPSFTRKKWSRHIYKARYNRVVSLAVTVIKHSTEIIGISYLATRLNTHAIRTTKEMIEAVLSIARIDQ